MRMQDFPVTLDGENPMSTPRLTQARGMGLPRQADGGPGLWQGNGISVP